jgi:CheY-like chemotaxis protein
MPPSLPSLAGLRILVVEDEAVLAMMVEDTIEDFGCTVHVAATISQALILIGKTIFDGVLLDLNIRGDLTTAVMVELTSRGIPFLLLTGYGKFDGEGQLAAQAPRLNKPFRAEELERRMGDVFMPVA